MVFSWIFLLVSGIGIVFLFVWVSNDSSRNASKRDELLQRLNAKDNTQKKKDTKKRSAQPVNLPSVKEEKNAIGDVDPFSLSNNVLSASRSDSKQSKKPKKEQPQKQTKKNNSYAAVAAKHTPKESKKKKNNKTTKASETKKSLEPKVQAQVGTVQTSVPAKNLPLSEDREFVTVGKKQNKKKQTNENTDGFEVVQTKRNDRSQKKEGKRQNKREDTLDDFIKGKVDITDAVSSESKPPPKSESARRKQNGAASRPPRPTQTQPNPNFIKNYYRKEEDFWAADSAPPAVVETQPSSNTMRENTSKESTDTQQILEQTLLNSMSSSADEQSAQIKVYKNISKNSGIAWQSVTPTAHSVHSNVDDFPTLDLSRKAQRKTKRNTRTQEDRSQDDDSHEEKLDAIHLETSSPNDDDMNDQD